MVPSHDLESLLRLCTVMVKQGQRQGTGFFVAPGLVVTCAHVVETTDSQSPPVTFSWQGETYRAQLEHISDRSYPDLALLRTALQEHPCVYLHPAISLDDPLYSFTYPDDYPKGDSVTCGYEGPTGSHDMLHKLKGGQIRPGMSGAPLLNRATGGVCGIIKRTRDRSSGLGGRAIPISMLTDNHPFLQAEQETFHQCDDRWLRCLTPQQQSAIPWRVAAKNSNPFLGESAQLLGRSDEVQRIEGKLRTGNHCSIVGPSGSGKSLLLKTITLHLPSWLECQSHEVLSIHCRGFTTLHELQSMIVHHSGGRDTSELRRLFQLKPLCLLILDDLGGMDAGEQGWNIRRWLRSLDDQYRTKLLMVSNERLEILFRQDDPTRDSPLDGLDPIPVELPPLPTDICRQIVRERLTGTAFQVSQFEPLFTEPRQPKELLGLCAVYYEKLQRGVR